MDDLLFFGMSEQLQAQFQRLQTHFLLKQTGSLDDEDSTITFLGRIFKRTSTSILMVNKPGYLDADFEHFGLQRAKAAATPGLVSSRSSDKPEEYLTLEETSLYRSTIGKLQWLAPLRPDIAFMAKELSRSLQQPTTESNHLLKHLLRYMKGTQDVHLRICPKIRCRLALRWI